MANKHDIFLATHDLHVGYRNGKRETTLLRDINVTVRRGQMTALLGRNGAGKSTLLRALTCFTQPLKGNVELAESGASLHDLSYGERSRLVGLVTTERLFAGALTVQEMVELGRQPYTGVLGRLGRRDRDIVDEAIMQSGIAHKRYEMIASLSDGERQKVMIAKALAQQTPIIYLDEPTAFLDYPSKVEMMQLLRRLAVQEQKTIFLSTHDVELSLQVADCIWLMETDQLSVGTPHQLANQGALNRFIEREGITFDKETLQIRIC